MGYRKNMQEFSRAARRGGRVRALGVLALSLALGAAPAVQGQTFKEGGTMIVGIEGNPPNLMAGLTTNILTSVISAQMFDTLLIVDTEGELVPRLAESWDISPDGLTYTFTLRPDMTWQDGTPLTSADVKYSFEELTGQFNAMAMAALTTMASIETPDPRTVIITLSGPDPVFFPWAFNTPNGLIAPKHIYEGSDPNANPANMAPVGSGAYKFVEWVRGSHIVLEKNPDYFDRDNVHLDRLVYQIMPEASARELALERGDIDYLPYASLPPSSIGLLSDAPGVVVESASRPAQGEILTFMNLRSDILGTKEVRHALAHAIDRETIVRLALDDRNVVATGPIQSVNPFYNPDLPKYDYDPERAKEMLDAAGYPAGAGGNRFSLRIIYQGAGEGGALQSAAEIMREQLSHVGIELVLEPSDAATYNDRSFVQWDFDLSMASFQTGPDPKLGISRNYTTESIVQRNAMNLMGYSNPEVDALFKAGEFELDPEKRKAIYQEIQALIVEDLPALWLWEKIYPYAYREGLAGLPVGAQQFEPYIGVGWTE